MIEGNYLLLDEPEWRELAGYADYTIFLESTVETLKDILDRLQRGGKSYDEALRHHVSVDHPNYRRVIEKRIRSHLTLRVDEYRKISIKGRTR